MEILEFRAADAADLECPECAVLMDSTATAEAKCKARVHEEREALKTLINVAHLHLEAGERYALLPHWWLSAWRRWITSSPWKATAAEVARGSGGSSGHKGGGAKAAAAAEAAVTAAAGTGAVPVTGVKLTPLDDALKHCTTVQGGVLRMLQEPPAVQMQRGKWSQVRSGRRIHTPVRIPASTVTALPGQCPRLSSVLGSRFSTRTAVRRMQVPTDSDGFSVVEPEDWEALKQYHGSASTPDLYVRFVLEDPPAAASAVHGDPNTARNGFKSGDVTAAPDAGPPATPAAEMPCPAEYNAPPGTEAEQAEPATAAAVTAAEPLAGDAGASAEARPPLPPPEPQEAASRVATMPATPPSVARIHISPAPAAHAAPDHLAAAASAAPAAAPPLPAAAVPSPQPAEPACNGVAAAPPPNGCIAGMPARQASGRVSTLSAVVAASSGAPPPHAAAPAATSQQAGADSIALDGLSGGAAQAWPVPGTTAAETPVRLPTMQSLATIHAPVVGAAAAAARPWNQPTADAPQVAPVDPTERKPDHGPAAEPLTVEDDLPAAEQGLRPSAYDVCGA